MNGETYSLKPTPNDRFLAKDFIITILFTLRVFTRSWSPEKYFFMFCFDGDGWHGIWTMGSRLVSPHNTDYTIYLFIFITHTGRNRKTNDLFVFHTYETKTADSERNKILKSCLVKRWWNVMQYSFFFSTWRYATIL